MRLSIQTATAEQHHAEQFRLDRVHPRAQPSAAAGPADAPTSGSGIPMPRLIEKSASPPRSTRSAFRPIDTPARDERAVRRSRHDQ